MESQIKEDVMQLLANPRLKQLEPGAIKSSIDQDRWIDKGWAPWRYDVATDVWTLLHFDSIDTITPQEARCLARRP